MFKIIMSLFFITFFFLGCSQTKMTQNYSHKEYKNISQDALLNAAKRVIKLSDEEFTISSYRDSISVIRAIPKNKGFTVDININELELITTLEDTTLSAKLKITTKDDIFSQNTKHLTDETHTLFWERVDYILGLRQDWYSCTKYRLLLNFDGFFCDIKYNTNRYPTLADIIKDTAIQKPIIIEEATINLATIDLSILRGIELPLQNKPKDLKIELASIDLVPMGNINQTKSLVDIIDTNETNISIENIATDFDNNTTTLQDFNTTTLENIVDSNITSEEAHEAIDLDGNITLEDIETLETQEVLGEDNATQINPPMQEEVSPLETKEPILNTKKPLTKFAQKFMNADPKNDYTINLSLAYTKEQSDAFILKHNIQENTFALGFLDDNGKYYIKLMYGVYKSKDEAIKAMVRFPKELKANFPTIEGVHRKQSLFLKKGEDLSVE